MRTFCTFRACAFAAALTLALPAVQATAAAQLAAPKINLRSLSTNHSYDRFIVVYKNGSTERADHAAALQNVQAAVGRAGLNRATVSNGKTVPALAMRYQRKLAIGADVVRASRKLSQAEATVLMQQIATDPAVDHVEADVLMHLVRDTRATAALAAPAEASAPDDPDFAKYQWHLLPGTGTPIQVGTDASSYNNYGGADTSPAWNLADGTGVTVAVLDTGLTHHPDIDTSLGDAGYDFISDSLISGRDADGRVAGGWDTGDWTTTDPWLSQCTDDDNPPEASSWHGTHVSGTIAELTNNGVGMAGSAGGAKILPVRVLGHCGGYASDISDAIVWASGGHVDGIPDNPHPAQVISMSLGGSGACSASDITGQAIAGAIARGTTVVAAAGNSGADAANFTPASCPGVIAVASIGITGKRAYYSNYGSTVALAAPGGGIYANDASSGTQAYAGFVWSAINGSKTTPDESNYIYAGMAGTSQATPHVSGAVALVVGARADAGLPALSPADIKTLLTSTVRAFPSTPDHAIGAGIIDTDAAVNQTLGNSGTTPSGPSPITLVNGTKLTGQSGDEGDSILYALTVPAGATNLNLRSMGGSGDVSLFVKAGSAPAADGSDADFTSARPGTTETVVIAKPQATTYYVRLVGVDSFANVSVIGVYTAAQ